MPNDDSGIEVEARTVYDGDTGAPIGNDDAIRDTSDDNRPAFERGKPIVIDPTTIAGSAGSSSGSNNTSEGSPRKRRGRPPGSGNGGRKTAAKNSTDLGANGLELVLFSSHQMLAALTRVPEMAIEQAEAKQLSVGIANVGRHYDMKINDKAVDWIFLAQTMAIVYGPRLAVLMQRKPKAQKQSTPQPAAPPNAAKDPHLVPWVEPEGFDPGDFIQ